MEISEVRVKLVNRSTDRLKAYCSMTIDGCFVIRDLKIIDGTNGLFVAMPSRKLSSRCGSCSAKNHLRARYCNECGSKLDDAHKSRQARTKLHADIAHPISAECREFLQTRVIAEYEAELERSKDPDYSGSSYDEDDYDEESSPYEEIIRDLKVDSRKRSDRATEAEAEPDEPDDRDESLDDEVPAEAVPQESTARQSGMDDFGAGLT